MVIRKVYHTTWTSVYIDVAVGGGNFLIFYLFEFFLTHIEFLFLQKYLTIITRSGGGI